MRVQFAAFAALIFLALSSAAPAYAADSDANKTVACKDGTTSQSGKGACSHHGGVQAATAKCKDGSMSYSKDRNGACSQHGGVDQWLGKDDKSK
jgi:hypothetical protein